jgi:hypothetical protein
MRHIKVLGLATVVVIATVAFLGSDTASAVFCKKLESPCAESNQYPVPSEILLSSTGVKLTAALTVLCESHLTLKHEGQHVTEKLFGAIALLDWSNCKGCTKVRTISNGTFESEATGAGNGKFFLLNSVVLLESCPFGAECTLTTTGLTTPEFIGGSINGNARILAKTTAAISGFGCGSTATLETESAYFVTSVNGSIIGSIFQE